MLRTEHFANRNTIYVDGGLCLKIAISDNERLLARWDAPERGLTGRIPTTIETNPSEPSMDELFSYMDQQQTKAYPISKLNLRIGAADNYQRKMRWSDSENEKIGEQSLVFVAFYEDQACGFTTLNVGLSVDRKEKYVFLHLEPAMVFVNPSVRKKGLGFDLSVACGIYCSDIFFATCQMAPAGYRVACSINADYESKGGEHFADHIHTVLECEYENILLIADGKDITVEAPKLDVGY